MKRHRLLALLAVVLTPIDLFADETIAIVGRLSDGAVPIAEEANPPRTIQLTP